MNASNLMNDGLTLMLFGMGFVFVFLTVLIFATALMSQIIIKYEKNVGVIPEDGVPSPTMFIPHYGPLTEQSTTDNNTLVSVLAAAVHKHRSRYK